MLLKLALLLVKLQHYYHAEREEAHTEKAKHLRYIADVKARRWREQADSADKSGDAERSRKWHVGYVASTLGTAIHNSKVSK